MIWSGLIVLSFIIYHLFDFTISPDYKGVDSEGRRYLCDGGSGIQ